MKPKLIIVLFALIIAVIGGGFYYFVSQPQKIAKPVIKEKSKEDIVEPVKEEPKIVKKEVVVPPVISSKPIKLNVHLHDFDEEFICDSSADGVHSCKNADKDKKNQLEISLIKSIPNGKFSVSENGKVIIGGNYIHGFINGEVTKYFSNGVIDTVENYKSGLLDGVRTVYSKDATKDSGSVLRQEQNWTQGLPNGIFVKNGYDGNLVRRVEFANGEFKGEI